jgi:hypothetical protein
MWKPPRLKFSRPLPASRDIPPTDSGNFATSYPTLVIVKVPLVEQLVVPVAVQVPVIVFPLTVPFRTSESLAGAPDEMLS